MTKCDGIGQLHKARRIELMVVAILSNPTIAEAAAQIGCSTRTLLRWQKHEVFRRQFEEAKSAMLRQATSKLRSESAKAVDVLAEVAGDAEAAPGARAMAARGLLELALRADEHENLERRIAALEGAADDSITQF